MSNIFSNSSPVPGAAGFEVIAVGAVVKTLTIPADINGQRVIGAALSVESAGAALCIRYKFGVAPTASAGSPMYDGQYYEINTQTGMSLLQMISADGVTHSVKVQYYF